MPENGLLDKYQAQYQIAVLQRLDRIVDLLEQLSDSPPMTIILPGEDSNAKWDDSGEETWQ